MRARLRPGMSRDELFAVLDELAVERGLRVRLPTSDQRLIALPVAEGGELLCFVYRPFLSWPGSEVLRYVEYEGDIFLEQEEPPRSIMAWLRRILSRS